MDTEASVARHYAQEELERVIDRALAAAGLDPTRPSADDLAAVDEFHIGGRAATADFAAELSIGPGRHLLDIGSGLGGPARYFALAYGCRVTGIDLTADFVRVAAALAERVGLGGLVTYRQGSALDLPFEAESFDGAYMLHVGMNIEDKAALFAGIRRVLRPGGVFGIYDVMRFSEGAIRFPVPWASEPGTSFVESPERYRTLLRRAGFEILKELDRRSFAIDFFNEMRARAAKAGPPPLGTHLLMGEAAPQKIANMIDGLERGLIAPVEIVSRRT